MQSKQMLQTYMYNTPQTDARTLHSHNPELLSCMTLIQPCISDILSFDGLGS